jgi:large subunit ribosomal protein L18
MKKNANTKKEKRLRRRMRIRSKITGTEERPRLSVYKSNKYLSAQVIDDFHGKTIAFGTTKSLKGKNEMEKAGMLGKDIAAQVALKKIKNVVFDRGGYIYTGKIKAVAEGAREGGLSF